MHAPVLNFLPLSPDEMKTFARPLLSYLPPPVLSGGNIQGAVFEKLKGLDELASPATAEKRARRFKLEVNDSVFQERLFRLQDGKLIVAGLRFRKLDPAFPFLHVTANFTVTASEWPEILGSLRAAFPAVPLRGITFRQGPDSFGLFHRKWSHTVFGRTDVATEEFPDSEVKTDWDRQVRFYDLYKREYQNLLNESPERNAYLRFEDEADLQAAAADGLLCSLTDRAGWGGVIAGREHRFYGWSCLYIFEIFLVERLRGRRLAGLLQRFFLRSLSSRYSHVIGHIDDSNRSSLNTALSAGRRIVETEYFVPFENDSAGTLLKGILPNRRRSRR